MNYRMAWNVISALSKLVLQNGQNVRFTVFSVSFPTKFILPTSSIMLPVNLDVQFHFYCNQKNLFSQVTVRPNQSLNFKKNRLFWINCTLSTLSLMF